MITANNEVLTRPARIDIASRNPLTGLASARSIVTPSAGLDAEIIRLLDIVDDTYPAGNISLEDQGAWWAGYYSAKSPGKRTLVEWRKYRGMTQAELGVKSGYTPQEISRWERGIYNPSLSSLNALANALGIDTNDIMFSLSTEEEQK